MLNATGRRALERLRVFAPAGGAGRSDATKRSGIQRGSGAVLVATGELMRILKKASTCLLIAVIALSFAGSARAALCGFPTLVGAGIVAGGTNYVVIASPVAPFPVLGIGTEPIGGVIGEQCRDIWRDATLGPAPPNFLVVAAPPPAAALCAGACFVAGFAMCTAPGAGGATLCLAFP